MMLLTRGRSAAGFAVLIGIVLLRIVLRATSDSDAEPPAVPRAPTHSEHVVEETSPDEGLEAVLSSIRSQGYRVTIHPLVGAIEMRATAYADPANVKSARVDRKGTEGEDERRCAGELAKQFGLQGN